MKKKYLVLLGLLFLIFLVGCGVTKSTDAAGNDITVINKELFTIFNFEIRLYALCIITGISIAYLYGIRTAKKLGFDENVLFDGFIWGVIIGVLGARIYYVIFRWDLYKNNPWDIIERFEGLAIHGAVIAASIFAYFYVKKKKANIYHLGEMLLPGFLIGQIFGRWGNFFNQEAHGGPIASTVAEGRAFLENLNLPKFIIDQMYISDSINNVNITTYMHPTFLYESLWNLLGLIIIFVTRRLTKKYWVGDAALFYLVWYGIGRYFVESIRTDYLPFNFFGMELRIAQVVSVIMIIGGITLFTLRRIFKVHPISYLETVELNKK